MTLKLSVTWFHVTTPYNEKRSYQLFITAKLLKLLPTYYKTHTTKMLHQQIISRINTTALRLANCTIKKEHLYTNTVVTASQKEVLHNVHQSSGKTGMKEKKK